MHMHAIGAIEITLVELDVDPQEENQEVQHQEVPEEGEPEVNHLPECPDHQPATFMKGKLRSIISLPTLLMSPKVIRIDALHDMSCLETLAAYYLSLARNIYHESYLSSGTLIMLSYAQTGRSRVISCHLRAIGDNLITVGYIVLSWNITWYC